MPALLLATAHGVPSIVKILRNSVPADEPDRSPLALDKSPYKFRFELDTEIAGIHRHENNKGIKGISNLPRVNGSNRDREYCGEYREIPFNFIRGFSRDMVKPRIPLGEGISFQGLSVRG